MCIICKTKLVPVIFNIIAVVMLETFANVKKKVMLLKKHLKLQLLTLTVRGH